MNVLEGTQLWEAELGFKSNLLGLVCSDGINFASPSSTASAGIKALVLRGSLGPTQGSTHMRQNPTA